MIIAFTGMPGGGKTTALADRARKAIRQGRLVFSNVNIKGTYKITFEDLITYRFPEGAVILIDESGRWFNSRKWASLPEDVFDTFTMHRHLQLDLYIAVQSFARIDKSLREVVELVYWARNSPFLPFHKYEGFYELEKVGSMRKDYDTSFIVWKTRGLRGMFNTHAMKDQFSHKAEVPMVEWNDFRVANKKLFHRIKQKNRIRIKRFKRSLSRHKLQWGTNPNLYETPHESAYALLKTVSKRTLFKRELIERGKLIRGSHEIPLRILVFVHREKKREQIKKTFMESLAESNRKGFDLHDLSDRHKAEEKKTS